MNKIIVCGYPKSGMTYLTKLVGRLTDAPVKGFLYAKHGDIAEQNGRSEIFEI